MKVKRGTFYVGWFLIIVPPFVFISFVIKFILSFFTSTLNMVWKLGLGAIKESLTLHSELQFYLQKHFAVRTFILFIK